MDDQRPFAQEGETLSQPEGQSQSALIDSQIVPLGHGLAAYLNGTVQVEHLRDLVHRLTPEARRHTWPEAWAQLTKEVDNPTVSLRHFVDSSPDDVNPEVTVELDRWALPLPTGELCLIYGQGGTGKSSLAMRIVESWPKDQPVQLVISEDINRWALTVKHNSGGQYDHIHIGETPSEDIRLLVVDGLADWLISRGWEENPAAHAKAAQAHLRESWPNATIVAVHHTTKQQYADTGKPIPQSPRGSAAWADKARLILQTTPRTVTNTKRTYGPKLATMIVRIGQQGVMSARAWQKPIQYPRLTVVKEATEGKEDRAHTILTAARKAIQRAGGPVTLSAVNAQTDGLNVRRQDLLAFVEGGHLATVPGDRADRVKYTLPNSGRS